ARRGAVARRLCHAHPRPCSSCRGSLAARDPARRPTRGPARHGNVGRRSRQARASSTRVVGCVVKAVVFAGPSLGVLWQEKATDGVALRAPAARGDLALAADEGAKVIGLADGVFASRLAVGNDEVRAVARRGVRLFGAASLGAYKALECPDAMAGIGWVYE